MLTEEDLAWWLGLAPTLNWRWAKSYAKTAPHSYVVRGKDLPAREFARAVRVIRTFGQPTKYWSITNIDLWHAEEDVRYWSGDAPVEKSTIINRASTYPLYGEQDAPDTRTGSFTLYDGLATEYDDRYTDAASQEENSLVARIVTRWFPDHAPTTLDVGCGTGLLLDLGLTSPAIYTGVDPSQGMLNQLLRKHCMKARTYPTLHPTTLDKALPHLDRYDLVTALFGAASYLSPDEIEALPKLLNPGGLLVLMHYQPPYLPDYYEDSNIPDPPHYESSLKAARNLVWPTRTLQIGHFETTLVKR